MKTSYWQLRVIRLAILGRLPFAKQLKRTKRRIFGYRPDVRNLRDTIRDFSEMEADIADLGHNFQDSVVLEIGTGWFPTVPIVLSTRGVKHVYMTDLNVNLDEVTFESTLEFLRKENIGGDRIMNAKGIQDFPLTYLAPFNLDDIPDASLDFIISRTVLEHIPENDLLTLLSRLREKLKPGGIMAHCVDHSDHLEHTDKHLSKANFLTWSTRSHNIINWLTKEGENRLRHHEYLGIFSAAGFQVKIEKSQIHQPTLNLITSLDLKGKFKNMSAEELAVLRSIYIVTPNS